MSQVDLKFIMLSDKKMTDTIVCALLHETMF